MNPIDFAAALEALALDLPSPETLDGETAAVAAGRIWRLLTAVRDPAVVSYVQDDSALQRARSRLVSLWRASLVLLERNTAVAFLAGNAGPIAPPASVLSLEEYNCTDDEYQPLERRRFRSIGMVGCGSYPETLLSLRDRYLAPGGCVEGIDASAEACDLALRVLGKPNAHPPQGSLAMLNADGTIADFSRFEVVVVANATVSKQRVVEQIMATARSGTFVLVRTPRLMGNLLYESADVAMWNVVATSCPSPLSCSLLLQVA